MLKKRALVAIVATASHDSHPDASRCGQSSTDRRPSESRRECGRALRHSRLRARAWTGRLHEHLSVRHEPCGDRRHRGDCHQIAMGAGTCYSRLAVGLSLRLRPSTPILGRLALEWGPGIIWTPIVARPGRSRALPIADATRCRKYRSHERWAPDGVLVKGVAPSATVTSAV